MVHETKCSQDYTEGFWWKFQGRRGAVLNATHVTVRFALLLGTFLCYVDVDLC